MPLTAESTKQITTILRESLRECCPPMVITKESEKGMEIIGNKPVPYGYKKIIIPGMYFSSFVTRKDMVSFYLFALYDKPEAYKSLAPIAMKCLKGKTCFNFKKPGQVIKSEIDALLKKGVEVWIQQGYMK
jgi:hypothetical protein